METFLSGRQSLRSNSSGSQQSGTNGFQPLFTRSLISPAHGDRCGTEGDDSVQPQVEVIEGAQGIEKIVVTCSCGKRIELLCRY